MGHTQQARDVVVERQLLKNEQLPNVIVEAVLEFSLVGAQELHHSTSLRRNTAGLGLHTISAVSPDCILCIDPPWDHTHIQVVFGTTVIMGTRT